jgi:hypothetical protein
VKVRFISFVFPQNENVPAGKVSCNAVRDVIVHEIVANIAAAPVAAAHKKRKSLRTKNASRTSQSHLWCNIAPQDGEPYSTLVWGETLNIYVGRGYKSVGFFETESDPKGKGKFEIGRILHLKSEIPKIKIGLVVY